jgi:XRE family aerobic/anaerobic benzoate catabolism transcriptional regulator
MARDICILLGERIRELRTARNWRQIDLAAEAELNVTYISDLENGRKEICLRTLQSLATAFDIKISDILAPLGL